MITAVWFGFYKANSCETAMLSNLSMSSLRAKIFLSLFLFLELTDQNFTSYFYQALPRESLDKIFPSQSVPDIKPKAVKGSIDFRRAAS